MVVPIPFVGGTGRFSGNASDRIHQFSLSMVTLVEAGVLGCKPRQWISGSSPCGAQPDECGFGTGAKSARTNRRLSLTSSTRTWNSSSCEKSARPVHKFQMVQILLTIYDWLKTSTAIDPQ